MKSGLPEFGGYFEQKHHALNALPALCAVVALDRSWFLPAAAVCNSPSRSLRTHVALSTSAPKKLMWPQSEELPVWVVVEGNH